MEREKISRYRTHNPGSVYQLCVLTKQVWVPISVLSRMWNLDDKSALDMANLFCGMSLATFSFRQIGDDVSKKRGLVLHDLHLEFCQQQAKLENVESLWHTALLRGYLESTSDVLCDPSALSSSKLVRLTPRPWWSKAVPEDGYIHEHLARYLSLSGRGSELAALLLDAKWMCVQGELAAFPDWKADYEMLHVLLHVSGRTVENLP